MGARRSERVPDMMRVSVEVRVKMETCVVAELEAGILEGGG